MIYDIVMHECMCTIEQNMNFTKGTLVLEIRYAARFFKNYEYSWNRQ